MKYESYHCNQLAILCCSYYATNNSAISVAVIYSQPCRLEQQQHSVVSQFVVSHTNPHNNAQQYLLVSHHKYTSSKILVLSQSKMDQAFNVMHLFHTQDGYRQDLQLPCILIAVTSCLLLTEEIGQCFYAFIIKHHCIIPYNTPMQLTVEG